MVLNNQNRFRFLALLASSALAVSATYAQVATAKSATGKLEVAPYQSAFEGYRAYTDDAVTNWKAANDTTARVGGWREYAKQAQQPDNTPSVAPPSKAGVAVPQAKP